MTCKPTQYKSACVLCAMQFSFLAPPRRRLGHVLQCCVAIIHNTNAYTVQVQCRYLQYRIQILLYNTQQYIG